MWNTNFSLRKRTNGLRKQKFEKFQPNQKKKLDCLLQEMENKLLIPPNNGDNNNDNNNDNNSPAENLLNKVKKEFLLKENIQPQNGIRYAKTFKEIREENFDSYIIGTVLNAIIDGEYKPNLSDFNKQPNVRNRQDVMNVFIEKHVTPLRNKKKRNKWSEEEYLRQMKFIIIAFLTKCQCLFQVTNINVLLPLLKNDIIEKKIDINTLYDLQKYQYRIVSNYIKNLKKDKSEENFTKDKSEENSTKDESVENSTKDESVENSTKDESVEKSTKDESVENFTKDKPEENSTKDESEEKSTKDESVEKSTKEESEENSTKDKPEENSIKDESVENFTKDKSEENSTKDESVEKSTKEESEENSTKKKPEENSTNEIGRAHV